MDEQSEHAQARELRSICLALAVQRTQDGDPERYKTLRGVLLEDPAIEERLPEFVIACRNFSHLWSRLSGRWSTQEGRQKHIEDDFEPVLRYLKPPSQPSDGPITEALEALDSRHVRDEWNKALDRRLDDPEGAITTAKSLLESVMKHILEEEGFELSGKEKMPELYHKTSNLLQLHPSNYTQEPFKKVLGSCHTIVDTVANLRNLFSDSHGKGKDPVRPKSRHAEFVVNLAGNLAAYIVRTWEEKKAGQKDS